MLSLCGLMTVWVFLLVFCRFVRSMALYMRVASGFRGLNSSVRVYGKLGTLSSGVSKNASYPSFCNSGIKASQILYQQVSCAFVMAPWRALHEVCICSTFSHVSGHSAHGAFLSGRKYC